MPRTQSSIAASVRKRRWVIFNASPDILRQIAGNEELQPDPAGPPRNSPIEAVVLTNGDIDHIAGLLSLREREPFHLYATGRVLQTIQQNSIFGVLDAALTPRIELAAGAQTEIRGPAGSTGIFIEPFDVPGKAALYLEDLSAGAANSGPREGDTIGVKIYSGRKGASVFYIPACARIDAALLHRVAGADCLLFDGTFFTDREMLEAGVGEKTAQRMGHIPVSGVNGSLAAFAGVDTGRRIYIHINNTNPILEPGSAAEQIIREAGWEAGVDGQEIDL